MSPFRSLPLAFLTLFLAAAGAAAQTSRSVVAMTLTQSDYGGGRVYVPARFGNFLGAMRLDTGASTTRIALAPWNKDLPAIGVSESTGASGRTTRCDDIEAKNVALKAAQGNDIARATYVVARCMASDGDDLLGLDFLKGARFSLNFNRREMTFFGEPIGAGETKPFRLLGPGKRLVGIDLRVGDTTAVGLFDTGAEICAVDLSFVLKHRRLFAPVKGKTRASEVGGKRFVSRIFRIKEIDIGDGRIVRDVYALAYDFGVLRGALGSETPIILGYNMVSRFTWELDLRAAGKPTWAAHGN